MNDGITIDGISMRKVYEKKDPKMAYTSRDYKSIFEDLVNTIPDVSQKWTARDESDPGIVLIKLMSMYGDMLSYNMDKQILECFPNSVTQRKNAAQIYNLIGYKMNWFRSAECIVNLVNTFSESATIQRFSKFTTEDGTITYTNPYNQIEVTSNMDNNGFNVEATLVQGIPVTPSLKSGATVPEENKPWHDIYNYNVEAEDILKNIIYLNDTDIDQNAIILVDNYNEQWTLVDNVNIQTENGKFFELRIDEYDKPYLYLVDYWKNMNILNFKLFYVISKGRSGEIVDNSLTKIESKVYAPRDRTDSKLINVVNYIKFFNYASGYGYNPETPDEARENSSKYINTLNTLVTLDDFTRFAMRQDGVANCLSTDLTTDPGTTRVAHYGDLYEDGVISDTQIISRNKNLVLLQKYIEDPVTFPLTKDQMKLADLNNDGKIDQLDVDCMLNYLKGDVEDGKAGRVGSEVVLANPLNPYEVKLYIVRDPSTEAIEKDDAFKERILTALKPYKMLPLNVTVDLESIKVYYWTAKGKLYLRKPVKMDEAQDILVAINNQLIYDFSVEKIPFNTEISYIDVVHSIENKVDNTIIDHVVLEPIKYINTFGEEVPIEDITGENEIEIPINVTSDPGEALIYKFTLPKYPVKPNSFVLNVNDGEYFLKDNGNGKISNKDGVLQSSGKIDYLSGDVELRFNSPQTVTPKIKYRQNVVTSIRYANLNTQDFYIVDESLLPMDE